MVEFRELRKSFGPLKVLDGISLAVRPGEITAIAGPNGAGKSTLLKCLVGLVRPDHGEVLVGGSVTDAAGRYRARIGYAQQTARFPENLSARKLFALLMRLRGAQVKNERQLAAMFDLEPALDRPLRQLSGGTRQKINLVVAAMFDPEILVLDEPTVGLDPLASFRHKKWLREQASRGKTVIVASHLLNELADLADRLIVLLDGRAEFDGPPRQVLSATRQSSLEAAIASLMECR